MPLPKYFSLSVWALEAWSPMPATMNSITTVNGTICFTQSAFSFAHHKLQKHERANDLLPLICSSIETF